MTETTKRLIIATTGGAALGIVATCFAGLWIVSHGHPGSNAIAAAIQGSMVSTLLIVLAFNRRRSNAIVAVH
ncbi:hypothetical protein R70006_04933 [Paraburkholderia domus]|uniref:hypothetical protein n=1 Tax=Paraburkholderia domus TaxID=2793075 RepID=UPI00191234E2|nr:hypothetical protein [Paraburkholderia domus]MBK5051828.1 hypothetical protein [Burkholderia sp. R-70006]CAE6792966.1 hypothetical protein R70006_04933 [Paraburkholderia domus]